MEESESGINLQELSNEDQNEAKKKQTKEKKDKEKQGTLTKILKILASPTPRYGNKRNHIYD